MSAIIARKEFIEMLRDGRFRVAALILLALLITALAFGVANYREVRRDQEAAQARDRELWVGQGEKNPHGAAHFGRYAFKPSPPLAFFDPGLNSYTGVAIWTEAHYQNSARHRPVESQTTAGRFGELSAAAILQVLLPLVIILLAFPAFAGERESGTLRQLLSLGVSCERLALGKAGGIAGALFALVLPATLLALFALLLAGSRDGALPSAVRFAALAVSYLLYFGSILAVTLAASAFFRSSRSALVALFGFWIFSCLLAPRLVADLSERIYPTPSRAEFWRRIDQDIKQGIDGHNREDKRTRELEQRVLAQYGVQKVEDLPINFSGISLQASEEFGDTVFDRHYGELWQSYARQNRLHEIAGALAPLMAIRNISIGLAGTDWLAHEEFARAAEKYRRALQKQLNDDLAYSSRAGQIYRANANLWEQAPPFEHQLPGLARVLRNHALSFALLGAWAVGAAAVAWFAARRMEVN